MMFRTQIKAASSVKKIEEGFYFMEYEGDYGFDEFLAHGGAASDMELAVYLSKYISHGFYKLDPEENTYGCSTIAVHRDSGGRLFGRNFDWRNCTAMTIIAKPEKGYRSVSTCNLDFLGFGDSFLPEGMMNKIMSMAAIYVPLDGMNEKGLCVADLVVDGEEETHQDTDRPELTTTTAIRLILDKAATADEAVELLSHYDMNSSSGMHHHLAICDGVKSVVVEYIENKMTVTETPVVTNFILAQGEHYGKGSEQSKMRFETLLEQYDACGGIMDENEVMNALSSVAQSRYGDYDDTQWSAVFDPESGIVSYCFREKYGWDETHIIDLYKK